jgi:hypothetical protein
MWGAGDNGPPRFPKSLFVHGTVMSSVDDARAEFIDCVTLRWKLRSDIHYLRRTVGRLARAGRPAPPGAWP